ncbi:hypothetical protein [Candidatus Amarobacter glycogenicus]|uniref:hypothetical protein n=1 Tax=Candidatus Amarobacter glycogenicus TaxID=3140699 RepID=UPI0031CC8853
MPDEQPLPEHEDAEALFEAGRARVDCFVGTEERLAGADAGLAVRGQRARQVALRVAGFGGHPVDDAGQAPVAIALFEEDVVEAEVQVDDRRCERQFERRASPFEDRARPGHVCFRGGIRRCEGAGQQVFQRGTHVLDIGRGKRLDGVGPRVVPAGFGQREGVELGEGSAKFARLFREFDRGLAASSRGDKHLAGEPRLDGEAPAENVSALVQEVGPWHARAIRRLVDHPREPALLLELPVVFAGEVPVGRAAEDVRARAGFEHKVLAKEPVRQWFGRNEPPQTEPVEGGLELSVAEGTQALRIFAACQNSPPASRGCTAPSSRA